MSNEYTAKGGTRFEPHKSDADRIIIGRPGDDDAFFNVPLSDLIEFVRSLGPQVSEHNISSFASRFLDGLGKLDLSYSQAQFDLVLRAMRAAVAEFAMRSVEGQGQSPTSDVNTELDHILEQQREQIAKQPPPLSRRVEVLLQAAATIFAGGYGNENNASARFAKQLLAAVEAEEQSHERDI